TGGTTHIRRSDSALDTIAAMVVAAAGRCAQQRFGARHSYYSRWCADDERDLIELALDLVEAQPRRDRKQNAIALIEGAEETAARIVDHLWPVIQTLAQALIQFPDNTLDRSDIEWFMRDVEKINFRGASEDEAEVDGKPFRIRRDGYLRPIGRG